MAIKIELDTYLAAKILRDDIVENLGHEGIEAVIEHYDSLGEDIDFDQSLFWCWTRYSDAIEALKDINASAYDEVYEDFKADMDNKDEEPDEDDLAYECVQKLSDEAIILILSRGDILVCRD